jgi:hypothetical protein
MTSLSQSAFELAYEISPIYLVNPLVPIPVPILTLTEMFDIPGIENGEFFAHFKPLPNSTLQEWQVAEYPFANLTMAANAVIQMPLKLSMLMVCPAQTGGGYILKQAQIRALKLGLDAHIQSGGTFTVLTPAYTYTNCLLTSLRDITPPSEKQAQIMYQWDFIQPLVTTSSIAQVTSGLINSITNGTAQSVLSW